MLFANELRKTALLCFLVRETCLGSCMMAHTRLSKMPVINAFIRERHFGVVPES